MKDRQGNLGRGVIYTEGQLAAALSSLLSSSVTRVGTGLYKLDESLLSKPDGSIHNLYEQINAVLDDALVSLHKLAQVNLLEVKEDYIQGIHDLKIVIDKVERLKLK